MQRSIFLSWTFFGAIVVQAPLLAQSVVKLIPATGHPGLTTAVSGTGFGAGEAVDVYVDTTDTLLLVSSTTGVVTGSVTVPVSAQPGTHYVTAVGRRSGDAAQASFYVTTPWLQFGFGAARRGWNPYENSVGVSNVSTLGELWSVTVAGSGATPAVSGGHVVISTTAGVQSRAATTGALQWTTLPTQFVNPSPTIAGTSVYIGENSGNLHALNLATGTMIWTTLLSSAIVSSAVVVNGIVYVASEDGNVYALQASNGTILWTSPTGSSLSSPTVVDGVVYFGSTDDYVYALNASTGSLLWKSLTGGQVLTAPVVSNGILFVGCSDSKVYAIKTQGNPGTLAWSYQTDGPVNDALAVANGIVYAGSQSATVYALTVHSGALLWTYTVGGSSLVRGPIVANGVVYLTAQDGFLYALNASNGGELATFGAGYTYFGTPAVSDGVVYVNSFEGAGNVTAYALLANVNSVIVAPKPSTLHPDMTLPEVH